ncbi:MAG: hypothetical protein HY868_09820 [Chloroflexi bacterium]|nr:hypothetical protein [Chloroflexota bacterium]
MPRRAVPQKEETRSGLPTWVIAAGIGVVVVVAMVALFMIQTPQAASKPSGGATTSSSRTKGNAEAKVDFVDWSDFQ